jgi:hypothetical protein
MMRTYSVNEVRSFVANNLTPRPTSPKKPDIDDLLNSYSHVCSSYLDETRCWGHAIFAGRLELDPEVERLLRSAGERLLRSMGEFLLPPLASDDSLTSSKAWQSFTSARHDLERFMRLWVTPQRSVSPSARIGFGNEPTLAEEALRRLASLRPHPTRAELQNSSSTIR